MHLRWDSTIGYFAGFRVDAPSDDVTEYSYPNADDGDLGFTPGLMASRFDGATTLSVWRGALGIDISADGWYDPIYTGHRAGADQKTYNAVSVPARDFVSETARLEGRTVELGEAVLHDDVQAGAIPVSILAGRTDLLWGESLFFPQNGVASAQAPFDLVRSELLPVVEASQLYLPVGQLALAAQVTPNWRVQAYWQPEWRPDRLPGVGSYFSTADFVGAGAERLFLSPSVAAYRLPDQQGSGTDQGGVGAFLQKADADFGFYAVRFDAKEPSVRLLPPPSEYAPPAFQLVYRSGIQLYGASFSTGLGLGTLAGEVSIRRGMPLLSPPAPAPAALPTGDTAHAQLSATGGLGPSRWWDGASLGVEVAGNQLLAVRESNDFVLHGRSWGAAASRVLFAAQYFHVLPGLDLTVPLSIGYGFTGRSAIDSTFVAGTGDLEIGVLADYRRVWRFSLTYTHFIGAVSEQSLADRDFVVLAGTRSF